jgi:serine/threonine-protein kinase
LVYIGIGKIYGDKVTVPDVQGMTIQEAALELSKVGLEYDIERDNSDEYEKDVVISQTPEADTLIRTSEIVTLVVSLGPETATVPNVIGSTEDEAKEALEAAGFTAKDYIYEFSDEYEEGIVIDQNPTSGIDVAVGTNITLYVSKGIDVVTMPKVKGLTLAAARSAIEDVDLVVGTVTYEASNTVEKGLVISQSVSMYSEVARNTSVDLVISLGPETTKTLTFDLSSYGDGSNNVDVVVKLYDTDGSNTQTVYDETVNLNATSSISVSVTGSGTKKYTLYIDGEAKETGDVNF